MRKFKTELPVKTHWDFQGLLTAQKFAFLYDLFLLVFFSLGTSIEKMGSWIHPAWALSAWGFDRCYKKTMRQGKLEY